LRTNELHESSDVLSELSVVHDIRRFWLTANDLCDAEREANRKLLGIPN
jgi:hypothetical protein